MSSRMSKYYEEPEVENVSNSRFHRNEELYREINKNELSGYSVKSNATILGENDNEIDVEKIKRILDTKYNETPQRKSIRLEEITETEEEKEITKEYDINVILEKAKEEKKDNYEEERLKKLRDTQFDILKNLNLEKYHEDEEEPEEDNLETLINTIAYNETKSKNTALDILSDLKGSDNTEVLDGLKEDIEEKEEEKNNITDTKMINSFYTSSNALKSKDFEDIEDFAKDVDSNNVFIKIIIAIIVLVFLVGVALIVKTIYFS